MFEPVQTFCFFYSGMADVALWLGPYMSISSQNVICTRTQKVHKCRQITTNQKPHKTHNQDDPQIPQPDLRFVRKNSKPDTQRGKSPNNKTHKKDLPRDTADLPLCHTQKHAKINYPPRHSVKHRNRSTVHSFVGIEKTCTRSRAYENCLSQRPLKGQKSSILCW